jgi:PadR family transcriptional regulator, regulatory protein PadR
MNYENIEQQMRKGLLEYAVLNIISKGEVYSSEILEILIDSELITTEGTLYPLLSRLKSQNILEYFWQESENGPPRKYYKLTNQGKDLLDRQKEIWDKITKSISSLQ